MHKYHKRLIKTCNSVYIIVWNRRFTICSYIRERQYTHYSKTEIQESNLEYVMYSAFSSMKNKHLKTIEPQGYIKNSNTAASNLPSSSPLLHSK